MSEKIAIFLGRDHSDISNMYFALRYEARLKFLEVEMNVNQQFPFTFGL